LVEFFIKTIDLMLTWVPRGYKMYEVSFEDISAFLKARSVPNNKKKKKQKKKKTKKNKIKKQKK